MTKKELKKFFLENDRKNKESLRKIQKYSEEINERIKKILLHL